MTTADPYLDASIIEAIRAKVFANVNVQATVDSLLASHDALLSALSAARERADQAEAKLAQYTKDEQK